MDVLTQAAAWLDEGEQVALATVISTWGSSPRPPGSQLAVTASGRITGSVSGGCVEAAVAEQALLAAPGTPKVLEYGVSDDRAWSVGLPCGGRIAVLVERLA